VTNSLPHIWIPRSEESFAIAVERIHGRRIYTYLSNETNADAQDDVRWDLEMAWNLLPKGRAGDGARQVLYIANPIPDIGWPFGEVYWQEWARLSVATSKRVIVYNPGMELFRWLSVNDLEGMCSELSVRSKHEG